MKRLVALALALILALSLMACGGKPTTNNNQTTNNTQTATDKPVAKNPLEKLLQEVHCGMTQEDVQNIMRKPGGTFDQTTPKWDIYHIDEFLGMRKQPVKISFSTAGEISFVYISRVNSVSDAMLQYRSNLIEYCNENYGAPTKSSDISSWWIYEDHAILLVTEVDEKEDDVNLSLWWMTKEYYEETEWAV